MPFQSEKQRRFLHANHPEIAKRWEKEYSHGGILDIGGSEEITTDDGNDIELTAYNAAFDGPTGVRTLFMKKGGNVRLGPHTATDLLAKKNPDGTRSKYQPPGGGATSLGSGRDYSGSDRGPRDDPDRFGPVSKPLTVPKGINIHADTGEEEEAYVVVNGNKVPVDSAEYHRIEADKFRADQIYKVLKRKDLTKEEKNKRLKWQWDEGQKVWKSISNVKDAFTFHPILGILAGWYEGNKLKKEQEAEILKLEKQLGLLDDWEMKSRHHTVDTPTQILEQRILNLTQSRDRDDIERNEFFVPTINLLEEEMDDDTQADYGSYAMSDLDRIRAGQAKRAMIQPDWQNPENILVANSGGLANLFRVKNQ
jgi:hypothetical protein